ncbi:MAG: hypothetical protein GY851_07230 [bacterium]|nr:hypothetical protein [bacterium]
MFWYVETEAPEAHHDAPDQHVKADGRFVVHRHTDEDGPHLDLRIECDGYLLGWRVAGTELGDHAHATEKAPHSIRWLDQDGTAMREDAGVFEWIERGPAVRSLALHGREGTRIIRVRRAHGLPVDLVMAVRDALEAVGASPCDAARLIADGATARGRAVERFCGLGRELDGPSFDETLWRKTLSALTLDEIGAFLRSHEARFDRAHPPRPVSRPERLQEQQGARFSEAMAILDD